MKKVNILIGIVIVLGSCGKAKIRTCTITPYSGDKYTLVSATPLTRSEMKAYEDELVGQTTPNGVPKSQYSKVCCK